MRTTREGRLISRPILLAVAFAVLLAGCTDDGRTSGNASDVGYVRHAIGRGPEATIGVARRAVDLLPNRLHRVLGDRFAPNTHTVIEARPIDIRPEAASDWPDAGDGETPDRVAFDDSAAESRTWLVTLALEHILAGSAPKAVAPTAATDDRVTVRLVSNGGEVDVDRFRSGILALEDSVWFLARFDDQPPDAFTVAWFGKAVAEVNASGELEFPLLTPAERRELVTEGLTIESIRSAGRTANRRLDDG